jgi:hypothetical protein
MRFISRVSVVSFAILVVGMVLSAQTATESNLLSTKKKGASDDQLIQLIHMSKKIDVDLSFENLSVLLENGLSQKVIDALIQRKEELGGTGDVKRLSVTEPSPVAGHAPEQDVLRGQAVQENCPAGQGVYYHSASGWARVEPFNPQPDIGKVKIMKVSSNWKFQGAEAPLKIQASKAEFCIRDMDVNLRNIALAVLKKNRDSREVENSSIGNLGHGSTRDPKKFRPVNASRVSDGLIMITLDLDDGEYALDLIGMPQYDFSVRLSKGTSGN